MGAVREMRWDLWVDEAGLEVGHDPGYPTIERCGQGGELGDVGVAEELNGQRVALDGGRATWVLIFAVPFRQEPRM